MRRNLTTVRAAVDADAADVANLLTQLGYPAGAEDIPARLARMREGERAEVWVAVAQGRVIGLITAHVLTVINRRRDVAQLTTLVVDANARRQGAGRALVREVEAFAQRMGCERLSVTTHLDRHDAHAFYEGMGFELTGRRYGKAL